jgi:hypothetical protein
VSADPNLPLLASVAERLGSLCDEMVFLGGCATGLLITDPATPMVRATTDVDVIVEVLSRADWYALGERLRDAGFMEDTTDGAPICRWVIGDLKLDVMPVEASVLGFGNRWYAEAIRQAARAKLPNGSVIRHVSAPCFLATKLEAFKGRGKGDFLLSHDLEDCVAVIDGRSSIVEEVSNVSHELREALVDEIRHLLSDVRFAEAIAGYLPPDRISQARAQIITQRLAGIAGLTA